MARAASLPRLPSVDLVLRDPGCAPLLERHGRLPVTEAVRAELAAERSAGGMGLAMTEVLARAATRLERRAEPSQRPALNLTGTVLHTNLGRALLAREAVAAVTAAMTEATTLEFDLAEGRRGERDDHVRDLLVRLTGAEDALVVNNNAAGVVLVLDELARRREVVVSRGELIEIGGSFRIPDMMARAGCRLREVGTTNRTHLRDYEAAIGRRTALLMKVHTSNYRIEGFTAAVPGRELAGLAHAHGLPLVEDLGSGTLVELDRYGLEPEPTVAEAVAAGVDLVTFSGDKLLGGPQAGIVVGGRELIRRLNHSPLKRALRLDKLRLAALEATLRLYLDPDRLAGRLPTLRLLTRTPEEIGETAKTVLPKLRTALGEGWSCEIVECRSQIGSGALPLATLLSTGIELRPVGGRGLRELATALRALPLPVIGRIEDGAMVLDLRCLEEPAKLTESIARLKRP